VGASLDRVLLELIGLATAVSAQVADPANERCCSDAPAGRLA
jgi:hypothetical protein